VETVRRRRLETGNRKPETGNLTLGSRKKGPETRDGPVGGNLNPETGDLKLET
jgi:hypothetical protein